MDRNLKPSAPPGPMRKKCLMASPNLPHQRQAELPSPAHSKQPRLRRLLGSREHGVLEKITLVKERRAERTFVNA